MGNLFSQEQSETNIVYQTKPQYVDPTIASQIVDKQKEIINQLKNAKNQISLNINNSSEPFANRKISESNIENFDTVGYGSISTPFSIPLSPATEVSDISQAYNQSIDLISDQNIINDAAFNTYINIQNRKLTELQNAIDKFPTNNNKQNNPIKAIKNIFTSNLLNVEEYSDPTIDVASRNPKRNYIGNGSVKYPNYLIYGNNGCLQYNNNNKNYAFQPCNANQAEQRFSMNEITNIDQYNNKINDPKNESYKIQSSDNTIMGFYVVTPENDPNSCITINGDGLSVLPCNMNSSQRFKPYYHSIQQ